MIERPVVSTEESKRNPYPYVRVEDDGCVYELNDHQREYLETPFLVADGGRPYVKRSYDYLTSDGKIGGYLRREQVPPTLEIREVK